MDSKYEDKQIIRHNATPGYACPAQAWPRHQGCAAAAAHPHGHRGAAGLYQQPTLIKIEKGDPGVSIGSYATVLFVLGMADRLGDLAAPKNDPVGLQLEEENLPQRIRVARSPKRTKDK